MSQYAGNLYNQTNAREVAVNTQKASPSSLFGTRNLKFYSLLVDFNLYGDIGNPIDDQYPITSIVGDGTTVTITLANPISELETIVPGESKFFIFDEAYNIDTSGFYGEHVISAYTSNTISFAWYYVGTYTYSSGPQPLLQLARYNEADSFYGYLVRAIQKVAEVYYLGRPFPSLATGVYNLNAEYYGPVSFVFGIANDTVENGNDYGADAQLGTEEDGYNYPSGNQYPGTTFSDLNSSGTNQGTADILQALTEMLYQFGFGYNTDGWYLNYLDDLGWGFLPGLSVGNAA